MCLAIIYLTDQCLLTNYKVDVNAGEGNSRKEWGYLGERREVGET